MSSLPILGSRGPIFPSLCFLSSLYVFLPNFLCFFFDSLGATSLLEFCSGVASPFGFSRFVSLFFRSSPPLFFSFLAPLFWSALDLPRCAIFLSALPIRVPLNFFFPFLTIYSQPFFCITVSLVPFFLHTASSYFPPFSLRLTNFTSLLFFPPYLVADSKHSSLEVLLNRSFDELHSPPLGSFRSLRVFLAPWSA